MRACLIYLWLLVYACSGSSVPKGVMSQGKMEGVLYDVIRADEMIDFLKLSDSSWQPFSRRTAMYDTVFQLHGVDKKQFQKSLDYYQGRPDLLKEIIAGIQEKVTDTTKAAKQRLQIKQPLPIK